MIRFRAGKHEGDGAVVQKISKRMLDALRPDQQEVVLWDAGDGALKGFGVRMKPSGSVSYLIQYRTREGRTRRLTLGHVGVLSVDEARGEAREKLACQSAFKIDP